MFAGGLLKADCRRCRRHPQDAYLYGCHEPARASVWRAPCHCEGVDPQCSQCGGSGRRHFYRCPGSMLRERPDVIQLAQAYGVFEGRHVLPSDGAWLDQAAAFTDAVSLLDRERAYWEDRNDKERERQAKRQQAAH